MMAVPQEAQSAFLNLLFKFFPRIGPVNVALCYEALRGSGKMSAKKLQEAQYHRDQARER